MKFIKNNIVKILSIVFVVLLGFYVCGFGITKARDFEIYKEPNIETKIYTVWHIETFEGGGKSRIKYLNNIARNIEKNNPGTLFVVKQINPENVANSLENSIPDIISFGYGLGGEILSHLASLDKTYNVRDDLVNSGCFNGQVYALPYIVSGYSMITHGVLTDNIHCGTTNYTKPENIYNSLNYKIAETESQYEAYKDFVYNKSVSLLGTGRDVYRVNNLNSTGRLNAIITPISCYTDLIQYIGITKTDDIISSFLAQVFSTENQNKLTEYSLFSSLYNKIYQSGIYNNMEDAIFECVVPNVFYEN